MKYAIVVPDGAADLPMDELDGKTPLAVAKTPNMDWLAAHGKCGTTCNIPEGMPCGSDVAILSLLGYDPRESYTGRAPIEAAAKGLDIAPDECVFRCNLVTIVDGIMEDHSAGQISTEEAKVLINEMNIQTAGQDVRFVVGVSYRHLMILKGRGLMQTTPPHDILGRQADRYLPKGPGEELLRDLIQKSRTLFSGHEINTVRRDLGDNAASSIWLWGQGKMPTLENFEKRHGIKGAAITAVDLVRGLASLIGWEQVDVKGATGYLDTNYAGKAQAAIDALSRVDLALVHIEAPDEAGHNGEPKAKISAIELIDEHIVGPVLEHLRNCGDDWRMLVMPDHPTPCSLRTHTDDDVPFAMAGKGIESILHGPFNEESAAAGDLHIACGYELMEYFLTVH